MTGQKQKILIVDDSSTNIQYLGSILKSADYSIYIANHGQVALDILTNIIPDLILLDIEMPDMNGFEVCRRIKTNDNLKDVPIIFLTAKIEKDDIVKGFRLGASDYVTKPYHSEELLMRINTHLSLVEKEKKLKELNATKDKFFSIIAHDLRNPFSGIISLLEYMQKELKEISLDELEKNINIIFSSANQGYKLLENLLEWARTQTNSISYEPYIFLVKDMVLSNIRLVNSSLQNKNISISLESNEDLSVCADFNMINSVIRNLLSNAVKFTRNSGHIQITIFQKDNLVGVSIQDNGIGISKENLNKLFRIDSKFSFPGTNKERGTGLGLILVKEFLIKNNGSIEVKSELGQGSTFTFYLPIHLSSIEKGVKLVSLS